MSVIQVLAIVLGLGFLIGAPAALIWCVVDFMRHRASDRPGFGSFTVGIGAAMQELDRLLARPSVEHTTEAENPVLKREDDAGDD